MQRTISNLVRYAFPSRPSVRPRLPHTPPSRELRCSISTSSSSLNLEALDNWISSEKTLTITDSLRPEHLSDLYITLPTRDGSRRPYNPPKPGEPLGYGHHLVFFHPRNPETALRWDGTDAHFSPPEPFTRRMWAGGRFVWKLHGQDGLLVGDRVKAVFRVKEVQKKGFKEGGTPMVFVKQVIEYTKEGSEKVAIEEERSHVYLAALTNRGGAKQVEDLGDASPSFDLEYLPSATTLFRFSALTFNGHFIHLDKEYAHSEGHSERLVHGPLTALMLLETAATQLPEMRITSFEYKAHNPLLVNRPVVINAKWEAKDELVLWAMDKEMRTVGMVGRMVRAM